MPVYGYCNDPTKVAYATCEFSRRIIAIRDDDTILERYDTSGRNFHYARDGEEKDTLARLAFNNLVEIEV